MTAEELYDSAERGPVDRDGARRTKSKHSEARSGGTAISSEVQLTVKTAWRRLQSLSNNFSLRVIGMSPGT